MVVSVNKLLRSIYAAAKGKNNTARSHNGAGSPRTGRGLSVSLLKRFFLISPTATRNYEYSGQRVVNRLKNYTLSGTGTDSSIVTPTRGRNARNVRY